MVNVYAGVITFRYTSDNIELLLLNQGDTIFHSKRQQMGDESLIETAIRGLQSETGLNLLVVSIEPIFEELYFYEKDGNTINEKTTYFAGIADPTQNVTLSDNTTEYLWVDHLGGRNTITKGLDIKAYENARNWLYDNDEAALFLANYLEKLQI